MLNRRIYGRRLQEFGIDIVGEDNKTVVHHKVSSKAFVVFTQQDVEASARELQAYQQAMARFAMRRGNQKPSGPNVNDLTRQIAVSLFDGVLYEPPCSRLTASRPRFRTSCKNRARRPRTCTSSTRR